MTPTDFLCEALLLLCTLFSRSLVAMYRRLVIAHSFSPQSQHLLSMFLYVVICRYTIGERRTGEMFSTGRTVSAEGRRVIFTLTTVHRRR